MTTRDLLIEDAEKIEEAASRTAGRCDIWQDRIVYNLCVAVLHLLRWAIRRNGNG